MFWKDFKLHEEVSIPVSLYKSMQGKYFVGQTETLIVGSRSNAWAGLINPKKSDVDLFVNVFTISNFSSDYITAEIWLNTDPPGSGSTAPDKISPTNTAIKPLPKNNVEIRFADSTTDVPVNGVNVYERIVPPNTTLVGEEDGKFIEAPNGNYVVFLKPSASPSGNSNVIVAFGWWEKPK